MKRKKNSTKRDIIITEEESIYPLLSFYTAVDLNILNINKIEVPYEPRSYEVQHMDYSKIRELMTPPETSK